MVVSIFVNPAQFAPHEDFASYPRTFDADVAALPQRGVDLIWAPTVEVMYPDGLCHPDRPGGPRDGRAGRHASARISSAASPPSSRKLLLQCQPDFAMFGEKDYQQLKVVTRMARDLDLPIKIVGVPTVREKDGLALSSRNAYLSADERAVAPTLHRVLRQCAAGDRPGANVIARGSPKARMEIEAAGFALDYLEARHAETLAPVATETDGPIRLLVAARLGKTRLIDNMRFDRRRSVEQAQLAQFPAQRLRHVLGAAAPRGRDRAAHP